MFVVVFFLYYHFWQLLEVIQVFYQPYEMDWHKYHIQHIPLWCIKRRMYSKIWKSEIFAMKNKSMY